MSHVLKGKTQLSGEIKEKVHLPYRKNKEKYVRKLKKNVTYELNKKSSAILTNQPTGSIINDLTISTQY